MPDAVAIVGPGDNDRRNGRGNDRPVVESLPEDSGWRFLAGSEDDEYTDNPENIGIFDLNTICNYDQLYNKLFILLPWEVEYNALHQNSS